MRNVLSKVCFVLFMLGVCMVDSETLWIPTIITFAGLIGFTYLSKEEK